MNSGTAAAVTSHCPFGLFASLAIFAINLFGPIPADAVNRVRWKISARITSASGPRAPGCAVTSR